MKREQLVEIIVSSLRDILAGQDGENGYGELDESTRLIGPRSFVDSLSLVTLIVDVEQRLREEQGLSVSLADERAMSRERSPFRSVGTLASYVEELAGEGGTRD
ncbi:MAG: hypothetical protein ACOC8N_03305 [Spirochaetota bacterium]